MTTQRIEIDAESIVHELGQLTPEAFDALPFGAIRLDPAGTVLAYNKSEERLSGRSAAEVIGRNFFREVAPCTRVKRFFGAFEEGVSRGALNEVFDFTFRFAGGDRHVRIRMIYSGGSLPAVWIFVTPLSG